MELSVCKLIDPTRDFVRGFVDMRERGKQSSIENPDY